MDSAADRLLRLLAALHQIDPYFGPWFRKGGSKQQARQRPVETTPEALRKLVQDGVNRNADGEIMSELGYSVSVWDGRDDGCWLSVRCGITTPLFPNVLQFYFPTNPAVLPSLLDKDRSAQILEAAVLAWEPDWANIASEAYLDSLPEKPRPTQSPWPGWMLYVAARRGDVPPLTPPAEVRPVDGVGSLIVMTPQVPRDANNGSAAGVVRAMATLKAAGLLARIEH